MFVIGTAGHVDHGKSTLVQALTGINPDRLREEQARQMTIDLGFAWLTLPSGTDVSIVDVPGHEDFIKNMLAGVGGIDVALLVVAADEAVMPQTREHLAIIDLLRIPRGVIALTKADLIDDPDWLDLVIEDVRAAVSRTVLGDAAIIPVSAVTGRGLEELTAELDRLTATGQPRRDIDRPRLPIDRVFTVSGFGTVVTGTLLDGRFAVGDDVEVVPGGVPARVRGLQTHKTRVDEVLPGYRVAMNLGRVSTEELQRGQVVCRPGTLRPTLLVDARLEVLTDAPRPLEHDMLVEFFCGSARVEGHLRLLDADALAPGSDGLVQIRMAHPVVVARTDRFIVRLPSPSVTLGGGEILQSHPRRRHKRHDAQVLEMLGALEAGSPEDVLYHLLSGGRYMMAADLVRLSDLPRDAALPALDQLLVRGTVVPLSGSQPSAAEALSQNVTLSTVERWSRLVGRARDVVGAYHARYPLRAGMPREELKSRLRMDTDAFAGMVARTTREGALAATPTAVRLADFQVELRPEQRQAVERLLDAFRAHPYAPPTLQQAEEGVGPELLDHLIESGALVKVSDEVLFEAATREEMERRVVEYLAEHGQITVAELRDLFDTSRRYALSFLEDLDRRRVTRRVGDLRVPR